MSEPATSLGFVGLGLMGLPMARRLLAAGCPLTVWNRSTEKAEAARADGAEVAASPADVVEAATIVFTCVTDAKAMEHVVFGPGGLAEADGAGKLVVDNSSIHPDATRDMAERLARRSGMAWLDAPVSGGVTGAESGTLAVFAGGTQADFERASPYLSHLSDRATRMGELGAGQTAKLCNQMIVGSTFVVIAEALRMAKNAGIEPLALIEAMSGGFADSKPLQVFGPRMLEQVDEPLAHVSIVLKDLDASLDVGRRAEVPMPMTATACEIYRLLVAEGAGGAEFDAIFRRLGGGFN